RVCDCRSGASRGGILARALRHFRSARAYAARETAGTARSALGHRALACALEQLRMSESLAGNLQKPEGGGSGRILLFSAVVLAAAVLALILWFGSAPRENLSSVFHLPFGDAEKAYAPLIRVEEVAMDRSENYLHQEVTTIQGKLINAGDR